MDLMQGRVFDGIDFSRRSLTEEIAADEPYLFRNCDFTETALWGASLANARFESCVLELTDFRRADLDGAVFVGGGGLRTRFNDADLIDATFTDVDLSSATFGGAVLTDVSFEGCRMIGAGLTGSRGTGFRVTRSNLTMANLGGCSLRGLEIQGVRFDDADLSGCDFTQATLTDCRLIGTKILQTVFTQADLRGADLGHPDDDKLRALSGAVISRTQAAEILAGRGITVI